MENMVCLKKIFDFNLERMGWRYLKKTSAFVSYMTLSKKRLYKHNRRKWLEMVTAVSWSFAFHFLIFSFYSFRLLVFYLYRCCADSAENSCTHLQQNTMRVFSYSKLSVFFSLDYRVSAWLWQRLLSGCVTLASFIAQRLWSTGAVHSSLQSLT